MGPRNIVDGVPGQHLPDRLLHQIWDRKYRFVWVHADRGGMDGALYEPQQGQDPQPSRQGVCIASWWLLSGMVGPQAQHAPYLHKSPGVR